MGHQHLTLTATVRLHTTNATPGHATAFASIDEAVIACGFAQPTTLRGIISAEVVARGQTSGSMNAYRLARGFKWETDVLTLIGTESSSLTCEEDAAWSATIGPVSDDDISVQCTGDASEHVEWTVFFAIRVDADT